MQAVLVVLLPLPLHPELVQAALILLEVSAIFTAEQGDKQHTVVQLVPD
jgi:hypothetical protein